MQTCSSHSWEVEGGWIRILGGEDLGGVEGGEIIIHIYNQKILYI